MIYVDPLFKAQAKNHKTVRLWCHMTADTKAELHEFAIKIGIKRCWFHKGTHYDLNSEMRTLAITHGAKEISSKALFVFANQIK